MLRPLVARCADQDATVRKFACFAVGNAAFHNDSLCRELVHGAPLLIALLGDGRKTSANAAGGGLGRARGRVSLC